MQKNILVGFIRLLIANPVIVVLVLILLAVVASRIGLRAAQATSNTQSKAPLWQDVARASLRYSPENTAFARSYRTLKLNRNELLEQLRQAPLEGAGSDTPRLLTLPWPDGSLVRFRLEESSVLPPALAAKYPALKSYRGEAVDKPGAFMRCDWSPRGLHATILWREQWVSIHPLAYDNADYYVSYFGSQIEAEAEQFRCLVDERKHANPARTVEAIAPENVPVGPVRRTYRLALATTVEYTNSPTLGAGSVATTMATLNTWVNAVNVIYEKELSIRFVLANNNDQVIFTAESDGLTATDNNLMVNEIRPIFASKLGLENYDLGQVLSPGSGGLAYISVVCDSGNIKGGGVSLVSAARPVGTGYGLITLAHEIGHQFSARHTFSDTLSDACNGSQFPTSTAYESFAGLTIMSYAEACTRIAWLSSPHFHSGSYAQITSFINADGGTCATTTNTGNQTPTINAGANYTIPRGTPFALTATGSDADTSDVPNLTYSWEQLDPGTRPASTDGSVGPLFRPFVPVANPVRTFPSLTYILNNANTPPDELFGLKTAETLPNVARDLNFRCMIRDQRGGVNNGSVVLTVANAGPFLVGAPNTAVNWLGGTSQTVSWSVNGTNNAPVNCQNVRISLSLDGGNTFPYVLATSAPNTGSAAVTVPSGLSSTQARLKIEAVNNIFFDISDVNFTVAPGPSDSCPAISTIAPVIGAAGTSITLNGANFTGVTAVKFANNVSATFTVESDSKITAIVPSGATSGLITVSKAGCADKSSGVFTVTNSAAYVSQVDDNSIEASSRFAGAPQYHFVNRLTPTSYPATLTAITLFIPNSVEVGTDYRLVIGLNTSGSSTIDGLPLQELPIKTPSKNQFVTFPIPNVTINAGDFVVGFAHVPQDGVFPVGIDTSSTVQNRSYASGNGGVSYTPITTRNYAIRAVIAPGALCTPQTCAVNTTPLIAANALTSIPAGSLARPVTIASVSDGETAAGSLKVTAGTLPAGITLANITNVNGTITGQITLDCSVGGGAVAVPLTVTDGGELTSTTIWNFAVAGNLAPTLGAYPASSVATGDGVSVTPNAAPTDNGSFKTLTASAPNFTGTFSVNPATGVVTINNAGPSGTYTVTVTATDNCDVTTTTQFALTVNQPGAAPEGDVTPRPAGNGSVSIADWTQVGRFVAGLDTPAEGSELQRADCAPRASFGDGKITIADWVQAGRYAAALDPATPAAGPTTFASFTLAASPQNVQTETSRVVRAKPTAMLRGQLNSLPIEFNAQGNENALSFSLNYDPARLSFARATAAPGTTLTLNTQASGTLGVLLALPAGQTFAAGQINLLQLEFIPNGGDETVTTRLRFSDQLVTRAVVDARAVMLPELAFDEADVTISGRAAAQVSAASYVGHRAASETIMSAFGSDLATAIQAATTLPLPTTLSGTRVMIQDSRGVERVAPLFFVSPQQINYLLPAGLADGFATVTITNAAGQSTRGLIQIERIAPGIFSADASGKGYAAADVQRIHADGSQSFARVARFDPVRNQFVANSIAMRADEQTFLVLYGTGVRGGALPQIKARIGGVAVEVFYAGPQGGYAGLDQINLRLPPGLTGRGDVIIELEIDGHLTNPVKVSVQ